MTHNRTMLSNAILLATKAHDGQHDRGGKPYILHPLAVMSILDTTDEELQCIAVLHDVIEDTNTTYADLIEAGMSSRVIEGVRLLTKNRGQTLEEYREGVRSNPDAIRVKMADLTHNSDIKRLKSRREKDFLRVAEYQRFYWELSDLL